jgi:hypothetical protein
MGFPVVTRATDYLVTAADWNADLVANMNSLMHPIARKTADESVTSSTTLQDDNDLTAAVGANEVWLLEFRMRFEGSTAGDLQIGWSFPSGGRLICDTIAIDNTLVVTAFHADVTSSPTASLVILGTRGAGVSCYHMATVFYINAGTAGNVTLRWAQSSTDGTATKMLTNSTLWGAKLA